MAFVLDKRHRPLMPCSEKRARLLLQRGRAVVHLIQPLRLKLDPGSKTTGLAVLRFVSEDHGVAVFLGEIIHRQGIKRRLDARRGVRRSRRSRTTRHRPARFASRTGPRRWLPPSLAARVGQTMGATGKLRKLLPITHVSVENVRFDTQALENPEIDGVQYQRGTLFG